MARRPPADYFVLLLLWVQQVHLNNCLEWCSDGFWRSPKRVIPKPLWNTSRLSSTQHWIDFWYSEQAPCAPVCVHCLLSCLTHVQLVVHQDTQILFSSAVFELDGPQHVLVSGVFPSWVQYFKLLVELHAILVSPSLQTVKVNLDGCVTLLWVSHFPCFGVSCEFLERTVHHNENLNENVKQDWIPYWPLGTLLFIRG